MKALKPHSVFSLFTAIVALGLVLPALVQKGMFLDGVTYSAISRNLANGMGTFWNPRYTSVLYPEFNEHPPLVFGLQALFFKLLGDGFFTERLFSLFTMILSATAIVLCWRVVNKDSKYQNLFWLPVLIWITIPLVFWSYSNNMLENTLVFLVLFTVYFQSKSLQRKQWLYMLPASCLTIMAFLTKGPVSLFLLATPFVFKFVYKSPDTRKFLLCTGIYMVLLMVISAAIWYLVPGAAENLQKYWVSQVVASLQGGKEITVSSRLSILYRLLQELIIPGLLVFFVFLTTRQTQRKKLFSSQNFQFFLLIGLAASLPLAISLKQRGFYLVPSFAFYSLSIGLVLAPVIERLVMKISQQILIIFQIINLLLLAIIIAYCIAHYGNPGRDAEMLTDIEAISKIVPSGSVISTTNDLSTNWGLVAYFARCNNISLDNRNEHNYLLLPHSDTDSIKELPCIYKGHNYILYQHKP